MAHVMIWSHGRESKNANLYKPPGTIQFGLCDGRWDGTRSLYGGMIAQAVGPVYAAIICPVEQRVHFGRPPGHAYSYNHSSVSR